MGKAYIKPYAVGADLAISHVQNALIGALPWLKMAFGRAERRIKQTSDVKGYYFPAVYIGPDNFGPFAVDDYVSVEPSDIVGNSCFFEVDDPQDYGRSLYTVNDIMTLNVSIIFWLDLRTIFPPGVRNTEQIKLEVISALKDANLEYGTRFIVGNIHERTENIYRGYGLREVDTQYLTHPYYGLRITGNLYAEEICNYPLLP